MEKVVNPTEQKNLIIELNEGREMANELKNQLDVVKTSPENCEVLVEKILSSYDKALAMLLTCRALKEETLPVHSLLVPTSPIISEGSNGFSKDQHCHNKGESKKRKILPKWSEQIRVCSGTGLEGAVDDGHSWRKYGQKDILGANFPRAYYRCTHRHSRGCLATKQVQRSDEDPSIFEVTYKGRHSCIQVTNSGSAIVSDGKEMPKAKKARSLEKEDQQGLKVQNEVLQTKQEIFRSFSFNFTGVESDNLDCQFFSDVMKESDYSPAFLSPTTSESNYFSSSCQMDNNFGTIDNILQISESVDLADMISTPTSVITNSPFGDLDFLNDHLDFEPSFQLDDPFAYFS
ncbi:hypothetical protein ACH5RR_024175 [Cinchona calisaya]|uniref:WRKY domain-containing protein n=1 Tax=Cinchona calisaya TaxID=153742 RepID=A0ABD2ZCV2_9GENT